MTAFPMALVARAGGEARAILCRRDPEMAAEDAPQRAGVADERAGGDRTGHPKAALSASRTARKSGGGAFGVSFPVFMAAPLKPARLLL